MSWPRLRMANGRLASIGHSRRASLKATIGRMPNGLDNVDNSRHVTLVGRPRRCQKKRAARCRTARVETETVSTSYGVGDVAHHGIDLGTNGRERGDRRDGDQGRDQRVLDGGGAMLVLHQATENGQHWNLQRTRTFFDRHSCRPLTGSGTAEMIDTNAWGRYCPSLNNWMRYGF